MRAERAGPQTIAVLDGDDAAAAAWGERIRELRERRELVASSLEASERTRRHVEDERTRAEIGLSMDEVRLAAVEREAAERAAAIQGARDELLAARTQRVVAADAEASRSRGVACPRGS